MTSISVGTNEEWPEPAGEALDTETKAATINEALHFCSVRGQAADILDEFDSVQMDYSGSEDAWKEGSGRDLSAFAEEARHGRTDSPGLLRGATGN